MGFQAAGPSTLRNKGTQSTSSVILKLGCILDFPGELKKFLTPITTTGDVIDVGRGLGFKNVPPVPHRPGDRCAVQAESHLVGNWQIKRDLSLTQPLENLLVPF